MFERWAFRGWRARTTFAWVALPLAWSCAPGEREELDLDYEVLLDDDFSTYPWHWEWQGVPAPALEPDFGFPAPSGLVGGQVRPPVAFPIDNQALDIRVTAYLQDNYDYGSQSASLDTGSPEQPLVGRVVYRLIINRSEGLPVAGYPAGSSAEIQCYVGTEPVVTMPVPYVEKSTRYDLFITSDLSGTHCGFDQTEVAASPQFLLQQGEFKVALAADPVAGSHVAWFDNLLVRRADNP